MAQRIRRRHRSRSMDAILSRLDSAQLNAHCVKAQRQELQETELQLQRAVEALARLYDVQSIAQRFDVCCSDDLEIRRRMANVARLQRDIRRATDRVLGQEVKCKKESRTPRKDKPSAQRELPFASPASASATDNFVDLSLCESDNEDADAETEAREEREQAEVNDEVAVDVDADEDEATQAATTGDAEVDCHAGCEKESKKSKKRKKERDAEELAECLGEEAIDDVVVQETEEERRRRKEEKRARKRKRRAEREAATAAAAETTSATATSAGMGELDELNEVADTDFPAIPEGSPDSNFDELRARRRLASDATESEYLGGTDHELTASAPPPMLSFVTLVELASDFAKGLLKRRMVERVAGLPALVRKIRNAMERLLVFPPTKQPMEEHMEELHRVAAFAVHVVIKGKAKKPRAWLCELQKDLREVSTRFEEYTHVFFRTIEQLTKHIETHYPIPTDETEVLKARVRDELAEVQRWQRGNFSSSDFQDKLQLVKFVLDSECEGWDPRADSTIEAMLDTLLELVETFKPSQTRTKREEVLRAWKSEIKTSQDLADGSVDDEADVSVGGDMDGDPDPLDGDDTDGDDARSSVTSVSATASKRQRSRGEIEQPLVMEKALLCLQSTRCLQRTPTLTFLQEFHATMTTYFDLLDYLSTAATPPTSVEWDVVSEAVDLLEHTARRVKSRERRHLRLFVERMKELESKYGELPLSIAVNTSKLLSAFPVRPDIYFKFKVYDEKHD